MDSNVVIDAVAVAIRGEFPDKRVRTDTGMRTDTEMRRQGFVKPCFFVWLDRSDFRMGLGGRRRRRDRIVVSYYDSGYGVMRAVADRLCRALGVVRTDTALFRCCDMEYWIEAGKLDFLFVVDSSYMECVVSNKMGSLEVNEHGKGAK